jgi:hypothetical protein
MTDAERDVAEQELFALKIVTFWQEKAGEEADKTANGRGNAKYEAFVRARLKKEILSHKQFPSIRECYAEFFGEK